MENAECALPARQRERIPYNEGEVNLMLIETTRCRIRYFEEQDLDEFTAYHNDLGWMQYQGFKGATKAEYAQVLAIKHFRLGVQLAIASRSDNRLIGDIYLKQEKDFFSLGYTIHPDYARQGYAYEAVTAVIHWLVQHNCQKIVAEALPENEPSIALLNKLGFRYTDVNDDGEVVYEYRF